MLLQYLKNSFQDMHKPFISVVIVNWNGRKYLNDCLTSLSKVTYKNREVLFIDNASTDDSVVFVKEKFPKIKIIINDRNLGFAQGQEVAFKQAKGDAVLLLSMDTIVEKNLIDELVTSLYAKKDIGCVQPKILLYPQTSLIDSIGSFFLMNGDLYHYGREKSHTLSQYNKPMEIFSAKGACMLIKKEVLKKVGLFDKDYFAYFEETDLCMRIWLAGYKIMYVPNTAIYHTGGGSSKQMASSFILFHSYKNGISTYIKNLSFKYLVRVLPVMISLYQITFLAYFIQGNFSSALAVQKAIGWNIIHLKKLLTKRKKIQDTIRAVSDDTYIPHLTKKVSLAYYYYQFFGGLGKYRDKI